MREPKHIYKIMHQLAQLWEQYPELRLAQLLGNVPGDMYYFEDDNFIQALNDFYASIPKVPPVEGRKSTE